MVVSWFQRRREERLAREEAEFRRKTYSGSVFMTQAQALTAATWVVRGGDEPERPDSTLQNLFLGNMIALKFGPRSPDADARAIWVLIATSLGVNPAANYLSIPQLHEKYGFNLQPGNMPPWQEWPPAYEWSALKNVPDSYIEMFKSELLNLSVAHRDDMPTMFLTQLAPHFGVNEPQKLRDDFGMLLLHAGFSMKTIAEDTEGVSADEREARMDLAALYEGRMLAMAKSTLELSERTGVTGDYCVERD